MFTVPFRSTRSRSAVHPMDCRNLRAAVELLEGRVFFTFNAYIAGGHSGFQQTDYTFVFSTTGQAAKH